MAVREILLLGNPKLYEISTGVEREMDLEDDLSELLQHECDHLDGVLAVMRAISGRSFAYKSRRELRD